jgi:hypothetical protein
MLRMRAAEEAAAVGAFNDDGSMYFKDSVLVIARMLTRFVSEHAAG